MILRLIPFEIESRLNEYNAEGTTDERRMEIEAELEQLEFTVEQKAEAYANLIAHYRSDAETIKAEEQRLAVWRKRCEASADWLDRTLESTLLALGISTLKTEFWKFSFRRSESLQITAADAIPEAFMIPVPATVKIDNAEVKAALKRGEIVPGAELLIRQNLQIK